MVNQDFLRFSAALGADPLLVQGAGGNTSLKEDGIIWIKASGKWLRDSTRESIFLALDQTRASLAVLNGDIPFNTARLDDDSTLRPSIEMPLHLLMPHRVVAHVHSVGVLALAIREDGRSSFEKLLTGLDWEWIEYARPGADLTAAVAASLSHGAKNIYVLANHGLVVGGDSCTEVEELLLDVERRVGVAPRTVPETNAHALDDLASTLGWTMPHQALIHALGVEMGAFDVAVDGPLYPDHVVFLGPDALVCRRGCDVRESLDAYRGRRGWVPKHLIVEGMGVIVSPELSAGAHEMLFALALVALRTDPRKRRRRLSESEVEDLLNWDAEHYRQGIGASG